MNFRQLVAGTAIVFGALAAGTGIASAVPSVSYVPNDDPKTPVNEAGTVQTTMSPQDAAAAAWWLNPLNPISPIGQQIQQENQDNDCVTINSTSPTQHAVNGYSNGADGVCNEPTS